MEIYNKNNLINMDIRHNIKYYYFTGSVFPKGLSYISMMYIYDVQKDMKDTFKNKDGTDNL